MAAIEILAGGWPASSPAGTAITMATGDSLQVRNAALDKAPFIANLWGNTSSDGRVRVRSPNMHDNVEGLTVRLESGEIVPQLPWGPTQKLIPQDQLVVTTVDATGAGEVRDLAMLVYYPDLPGISARLVTAEEVIERTIDLHHVRVSIATTPSLNWQGSAPITKDQDLLRANTDYAILGFDVGSSALAIGIRGVDTGNLRVGGPGDNNARWTTTNWFMELSRKLGVPCVPVFNSANKNGVFVDVFRSESGVTEEITLYLARFRGA